MNAFMRIIGYFASWRGHPRHLVTRMVDDRHRERCAYDYCEWCARHRDDGWWHAEDENLGAFVVGDAARTWLELTDRQYGAQYDPELDRQVQEARQQLRAILERMDFPRLDSVTEAP